MIRIGKVIEFWMDRIKYEYRRNCKHTKTENLGEPMFSDKAICLRCGGLVNEKESNQDTNQEGGPPKKTVWDYNWSDL